MFDKKMMKKMALKSLMESLMGEDESGEGKKHERGEMEESNYSERKPQMKATIIADSEEGLLEGAKKLPKILSKSEEYMKKRMDEIGKSKSKKK